MPRVDTRFNADVLRYRLQNADYRLSGGVLLATLANHARDGDAEAFRNLVLLARQPPTALAWEVHLTLSGDHVAGINLGSVASQDACASMFAQALLLQQQGRREDAIEVYNRILAEVPEEPSTLMNRAASYYELGAYDLALADLDKLLLDPSYAAKGHHNRGVIRRSQGLLDEAIKELTIASELDSHLPDSQIILGRVFMSAGRYDSALDAFSEALHRDSESTAAHEARAEVLAVIGREKEALGAFATALKIDPLLVPAYIGRAKVYLGLGQNDWAIDDLSRALELGAQEVDLNLLRGLAHGRNGHDYLALKDFNVVLASNPDNIKARYYRAISFAHQGRNRDAIQDLSEALSRNPENTEVRLLRAQLFLEVREFKNACDDWRTACAVDAQCPGRKADLLRQRCKEKR